MPQIGCSQTVKSSLLFLFWRKRKKQRQRRIARSGERKGEVKGVSVIMKDNFFLDGHSVMLSRRTLGRAKGSSMGKAQGDVSIKEYAENLLEHL